MMKTVLFFLAFAIGFAFSLSTYASDVFEIGETTKVRCRICEKIQMPQ